MFANDKHKKLSRECFVSNECESDQYRETQPESGLRKCLHLIRLVEEHYWEESERIMQLFMTWLMKWNEEQTADEAWKQSYAGSNELKPLLERYHDILWERNAHPYYDDEKELVETLYD